MFRTIELTTDKTLIKQVIKDDYDLVTYDGCPDWDDFQPDIENALWFILKYDSETAGLIKLDNLNWTTWIPHIIIDKEYRGGSSEQWGKLVVQYMAERIKNINFLVLTPYEHAKKYAERVGFKYVGMLPNSITRQGKLLSQYILTGDGQ